MPDFTPWSGMAQSNEAPKSPEPSTSGTKRDFANMLNEKVRKDKPRKMGTHWELPKKLKLSGF